MELDRIIVSCAGVWRYLPYGTQYGVSSCARSKRALLFRHELCAVPRSILGAARRLGTVSNQTRSVSNDSCQHCHRAAKHAAIALVEPACADCHQEHRPDKRLIDLADNACTQCHRDLERAATTAVGFVSEISQFEAGAGGHPEFALLRPADDRIGERHHARSIAQVIDAGEGTAKWVDRGGLKFTHQLHLDPSRVLGPDRKPTQLTCSDCHVASSDGYMQPINYERNCSRCHPLKIVDPFSKIGELPHSSVEEVRGVIRGRLARLMEQPSSKPADSGPETRLPRFPRPAKLSADQERDLAAELERADHAIFGMEAKGACSRCHYFVQQNGEWNVHTTNPNFPDEQSAATQDRVVEMVPSRWMRHATFNHKSHRTVECAECHQAKSSNQTSDILMPSISVCRTCHGDAARTSRPHVSADCVLCHTYHMEGGAHDFPGVPLEQLFSNPSAHPSNDATR